MEAQKARMFKSLRHSRMALTRDAARLDFEAQSVIAPAQGAGHGAARKALGCDRRRVRAHRRRPLRKTS
jgi:hypothetical protein